MGHKKKPDPVAQQAFDISGQERRARDTELAKADPTLNYYSGPPDQSPLYKSLSRIGTENTSRRYDDAMAATRMRANAAGFGYQQPVEQGAERELEAERAGALSRVPSEALLAATQPGLQAAQIRTGRGYAYSGAPYFGYGANLYNQQQQRNANLWNKLFGLWG